MFDSVDDYVDLVDQRIGGEMTIMLYAWWDALNWYSRLCDFGDGGPTITSVANNRETSSGTRWLNAGTR